MSKGIEGFAQNVSDMIGKNGTTILLCCLVFGVFAFLKSIIDFVDKNNPFGNNGGNEELEISEPAGTSRKYSDDKVKVDADLLQAAMDEIGTDYATINNVYNAYKDSKADFVALYNFFGKRPYSLWGYSTNKWADKIDLLGWLKRESSSKYSDWLKLYNSYVV